VSALRFKGLIGDNLLIEYTKSGGNYVLRRHGQDVLTFPAISDLEELAEELQQVAKIFRQLEGKTGYAAPAPKQESKTANPPPLSDDTPKPRHAGGRPRKSRDVDAVDEGGPDAKN
jgi:hypothetical protein